MENNSLPNSNIGAVIRVLEDMTNCRIISTYAVGGAVAATLHYEPISTVDLDIFILLAKPPGLLVSYAEIYNYARERNFNFDSEFINIYGWLVQFVESSHNPLWIEAIDSAEIHETDGYQFNVIDAEHLAAMWILAGRKKDILKIGMFDEAGIMDGEILLDILTRFDLLEKWRSLQYNFSDDYRF